MIVYAGDPLPEGAPSIFLAGPTPRSPEVPSWRPEAVNCLWFYGFLGRMLVPEPRGGDWTSVDKHEQWDWEARALEAATVILFWVPREMKTMPGLSTNDEWGAWKTSGKCVFGAPRSAVAVAYQHWWCERLGVPFAETIEELAILAVDLCSRRVRGGS